MKINQVVRTYFSALKKRGYLSVIRDQTDLTYISKLNNRLFLKYHGLSNKPYFDLFSPKYFYKISPLLLKHIIPVEYNKKGSQLMNPEITSGKIMTITTKHGHVFLSTT